MPTDPCSCQRSDRGGKSLGCNRYWSIQHRLAIFKCILPATSCEKLSLVHKYWKWNSGTVLSLKTSTINLTEDLRCWQYLMLLKDIKVTGTQIVTVLLNTYGLLDISNSIYSLSKNTIICLLWTWCCNFCFTFQMEILKVLFHNKMLKPVAFNC